MMPMRTIVTAAAVLLTPPSIACAGQAISLDGSYEITTRLELPHVERWAVDRTTKICLAGAPGGDAIPIPIPIPVLSANDPFASCAATNLTMIVVMSSMRSSARVGRPPGPMRATSSVPTVSRGGSRW